MCKISILTRKNIIFSEHSLTLYAKKPQPNNIARSIRIRILEERAMTRILSLSHATDVQRDTQQFDYVKN